MKNTILEIRRKNSRRLIVSLTFTGQGSRESANAAAEAALRANPDSVECDIFAA
jgi:ABC-type sugar transport system substrate-binding protein